MKRSYSKNALWGCMLAIGFALFGAGQLEAQVQATTLGNGGNPSAKGVYALPQGNFVNATQAEGILLQQMEQLMAQMKANPGSPIFSGLERKYNYFSAIRNEIATGKSVKEAIVSGLAGAALPLPRPSQLALTQLKQEAVSLLIL